MSWMLASAKLEPTEVAMFDRRKMPAVPEVWTGAPVAGAKSGVITLLSPRTTVLASKL